MTASFFSTLGVQPQIGRFFTEAEDKPAGERVMVISDALWRRHFDADPGVLGRAITYNGESWTVTGVLPRSFEFYGRTNENNDLFIPLGRLIDKPFMLDRGSRNLRVVARLAPGITPFQAQTEMVAVTGRLASQYPVTNTGIGVRIRSLLDDYVGETRPALLITSLGAILVLLIACANLANLTFVRGAARAREIAVRVAIGSSRAGIVRLLLTESLVLALIGGALGILLAVWAIDAFKAVGAEIIPRIDQLNIDFRVLALSALTIAISTAFFGLLPATQTARVDLNASLKFAPNDSGRDPRRPIRRLLVMAELTLALTLLITAGLLTKSFWRMMNVSPGFNADNVLTFRLRLPDAKYPDAEKALAAVTKTRRRIGELSGVKAVAVSSGFPLGRANQNSYRVEGQPEPANVSEWPSALALSIDENYCRALGITFLAGRTFCETDDAQRPPVLIVDQEFVRRHFANDPRLALGRRLQFSGDAEAWREVVGVVNHVTHYGLEEHAAPEIYRPWTQMNPRSSADYLRAMDFIIKTSGTPGASHLIVDGDYFRSMRIPLLAGRAFEARDDSDGAAVTMINEAFARKFFPNENPVGKVLRIDTAEGKPDVREIIGVVGSTRHESLAIAPIPEMYVPAAQDPTRRLDLVLRTSLANLTPARKRRAGNNPPDRSGSLPATPPTTQ